MATEDYPSARIEFYAAARIESYAGGDRRIICRGLVYKDSFQV